MGITIDPESYGVFEVGQNSHGGVATQLPKKPCAFCRLVPAFGNSDPVYVGPDNTLTIANGYELPLGVGDTFFVKNLNLLFINGATALDRVTWIIYTENKDV